MSTAIVNEANVRLDQFFTVAEARQDRWRNLLTAARAWEAAAKQDALGAVAKTKLSTVEASFSDLRQWENFFAYPGPDASKDVGGAHQPR